MTSTAASPYAAPASNVEDVSANPAAEAIRREHIKHEASIRSVGVLYYLGGALMMIIGLGSLVGSRVDAPVMILLIVVGGAQIAAGWGVRALRPWGRGVGTLFSVIGLLAFPIGTLISGYILYLFFSRKGRNIFAPEYPQVIAATPHVKVQTDIVAWIVLALLVGSIVVSTLYAMFG